MASRSIFGTLCAAFLLALGANVAAASTDCADYIVALRPGLDAKAFISFAATSAATEHLRKSATHVYSHAFSGFSARLSFAAAARLAQDPQVSAVVPDAEVDAAEDPASASTDPSPSADPGASPDPSAAPSPTPTIPTLPTPGPDFQVVPTGVQRVGRPNLAGQPFTGDDKTADIDIAVVDTGVFSHPDLNVVGGVDCTGSAIGWNDGYGHGTHVSGTAAARDNGFGVVGVAPGARIWSVKVLNANGHGRTSWLLCGIDWIAAQRDGNKPLIEVANMSLYFRGVTPLADDHNCGYSNHDPVHQATCAASAAGTIFVVAAGNSNRDAKHYRPAAYDEVLTVSALSDFDGKRGGLGTQSMSCPLGFAADGDDVLAKFSDYGRDIDLMAPGKCIWSTNNDGGYRAMSGTSMATPLVTGTVALYLIAHPDWTFKQIRAALIACGTRDWRRSSDRDRFHERLLNVSRLCSP